MTHHIPALARTRLHRCMQIFKPVGGMQFVLLTLTGLISATTYANDDVAGFWASGDSVLHISIKDQSLSAVVVAMLDPVYREDEEFGPAGAPRRLPGKPFPLPTCRAVLNCGAIHRHFRPASAHFGPQPFQGPLPR